MQYRSLGKSPLQVSRLCLGTMMFGDQTDSAEAQRICDHARGAGVNFIDTADVYTTGAAETMVGGLIKQHRHEWVLATKVGNKMSERPNEGRYARSWVLRACDASLQRLATDHVDIYYLHRDFNGMDLEEPLRALDALLRAGKIRYWGLSNFRGWRIAEAVHLARQLGMPGPVVCQPYYNLLNRQPEVEVLEVCHHHGIGVVPYSPIARGVLAGKYLPGAAPAAGSRAARGDKRILQTEFRQESLAIAQTLKAHCERKGDGHGIGKGDGDGDSNSSNRSSNSNSNSNSSNDNGLALAHFATAWVLAHKAVSAVIAGPRTLQQWQSYFGALDCSISAEDEALVDSLVAPGHPSTPGYNDPAYPLPARVRTGPR